MGTKRQWLAVLSILLLAAVVWLARHSEFRGMLDLGAVAVTITAFALLGSRRIIANEIMLPKNFSVPVRIYFAVALFCMGMIFDNPGPPGKDAVENRKILLQISAGLLGSAALFFAWVRASHTERQLQHTETQLGQERELQRQELQQQHELKDEELRQRKLQGAIKLLAAQDSGGNPLMESRIFSILLLETLARRGEDNRLILETICEYLRLHANEPEEPQTDDPDNEEHGGGKGKGKGSKKPPSKQDISACCRLLRRVTPICKEEPEQPTSGQLTDPEGLDLHGIWLEDEDLSRANLRKCKLDGAHLTHCDLKGTIFNGSFLNEADLSASFMNESTKFDLAKMEGAVLASLNATGVSFCGAILTKAEFRDTCNLADGKFHGANLTAAHFGSANVKGAIFDDATLDDADWTNVQDFSPEQIAKVKSSERFKKPVPRAPAAEESPDRESEAVIEGLRS